MQPQSSERNVMNTHEEVVHCPVRTILIMDDSVTMRHILRHLLQSEGYAVHEARSAAEALVLFRETAYDLVALDVNMPDQDGFAVCAAMRAVEAQLGRSLVPTIFITNADSLEERRRGFELGATDFVGKPLDEADFLARVGRILRRGHQLDGLRVLVAEDSRATRNIIVHTLQDCGLRVDAVEDGLAALKLLQQNTGAYDLVVTDFDMPEMDGKALCHEIRTVLGLPWLPVLFLSGMCEMSYVLEMFEAGATDYITKPFTREELVARISVHIEVRRLNQERQKQVRELERLNAMKDRLVAIASHDLRSPLTCILGYAGVLLHDPKLPDEYRDPLQGIRNSARSLTEIVNDLLDLARLQSHADEFHLVPCCLQEIVEESLKMMVFMAGPKGVTVVNEGSADGAKVWVSGERNALLRLVNNLVSNAIKFTPVGGRVWIRCERGSEGAGILQVSDTGIGIPEGKLGELFKQFTCASRKGTEGEPSTGLGMSIVHEIASLHGATVTVKSKPDEGSVFSVSFPPMPT